VGLRGSTAGVGDGVERIGEEVQPTTIPTAASDAG
jgi:hypothetical protein